ncbi:MAG: DUF523 domain-containing protein [Pseudomonadota bacterium]
MNQPRILVSACLLGEPVRYNGSAATLQHELLKRCHRDRLLVPLCPEIAAGFETPRRPAEIVVGHTGTDIWQGRGAVVEDQGANVTAPFREGARIAVDTARKAGCRFALLTDGSPSCGTNYIYSGQFDGQRRQGQGVVAAALQEAGVRCFSQSRIGDLAEAVASFCSADDREGTT